MNNINNTNNSYDFNDYRDKNNINNIIGVNNNEKNKNKGSIIDNIPKENLIIKKDIAKSNKMYKNELKIKQLSSKKAKIDKDRKDSKKKRENLSIKNYIKRAKNLFDEEKINKDKNNSISLNDLEIKYEEKNKNFNNSLNEIYKPHLTYTKNRSCTEKTLKNLNPFSTGNRKKTRNRNIIINNNNNFINSNIKRKSFHKNKKNIPKNRINLTKNINNTNNSKNNTINKEKKIILDNNKSIDINILSPKEKSFYLLSNSPILRLSERLIFGRSTQNLRKIESISDILNKNQIFLKDKIKELDEKINECDKKINIVFNPSKTAEINFNFILSKDEEELKHFTLFTGNETDKKEYYIYIKIIYILFDVDYENIELNKLNGNIYVFLNKKGFKNIKDYLYYIYFKNKDNINIISKINKINNLFGDNIYLSTKNQFKFCRFALFTSFLINEIISYGNNIKNIVDLKIKTKELIDVIKQKMNLYYNKIANINKTK